MKKSILGFIGLLFSVSLAVTSCEETDGTVDPYKDWQVRNERFIDSIADVARSNQGDAVGQWKIIHTYKYPQQGITMGAVDEYVYCKVLEVGDGDVSPLFTDTVSVNYRGWLIPLYDGTNVVFDQSYQGELNRDEAIPVDMVLYGKTSTSTTYLVTGWQTALQEMNVGDRWQLYIPSDMGYGVSGSSGIPGYSTLIFDLDLVEVKKLKGTPQE